MYGIFGDSLFSTGVPSFLSQLTENITQPHLALSNIYQIFTSEVAGQCSGNLHLGGNLCLCATFTFAATFTFVTTFTMEGKWQADQLKLELTAEGEGV